MEQKALTKARSRLRVAKNAVDNLVGCKDYDIFTDHWYTFLTAAKNVYTVLEQGAKKSPQSRQWFGGKKRERHDDPLLQYIYQARNDDEHGIEPVTESVSGHLAIGVAKPGFSNNMTFNGTIGPGGLLNVTSNDGKPVLIEQVHPHIKLVRVHDRGRRAYDPPTVHKGTLLKDNSPFVVASLTLEYLSSLLIEAEGFHIP